jgi:hypothetical protein
MRRRQHRAIGSHQQQRPGRGGEGGGHARAEIALRLVGESDAEVPGAGGEERMVGRAGPP